MNFINKIQNILGLGDNKLVEGGVYVVKRSKGKYPYRVQKILEIGGWTIAVRQYRNAFKEFPKDLDLETLSIALPSSEEAVTDPLILTPDSPIQLGYGCIPIDKEGYLSPDITLVIKTKVSKEESENVRVMVESMKR